MGKFQTNKEKLLAHIYGLTKKQTTECVASTKFLAKSLGVGTRQIYRYLKELKKEGKVFVTTSKMLVSKNDLPYKIRKIKICCQPPANTKEIRQVYFDIKKKSAVVEQHDIMPEQRNINNSEQITYHQVIEKLFTPAEPISIEPLSSVMTPEKQEIVNKVLEEEQNQRFKDDTDLTIKQEIAKIWDPENELKGETQFDKLIYAYVQNYKNNILNMQSNGTYEYVRNLLLPCPENLFIENNEYWVMLYIPIGDETVDHKIRLFDYVPWNESSWEFTELMKSYEELKKNERTP
jgi:hypothetical protein